MYEAVKGHVNLKTDMCLLYSENHN